MGAVFLGMLRSDWNCGMPKTMIALPEFLFPLDQKRQSFEMCPMIRKAKRTVISQ
jgi:hypothetical protein